MKEKKNKKKNTDWELNVFNAQLEVRRRIREGEENNLKLQFKKVLKDKNIKLDKDVANLSLPRSEYELI